jgi:hypothetical protein
MPRLLGIKAYCQQVFASVSPTSQPAYESSSVAVLRSLAANRGADPDDITRDFQNGNLARYFTRTDNIQSAPALAESRAVTPPTSVRQKQLQLLTGPTIPLFRV